MELLALLILLLIIQWISPFWWWVLVIPLLFGVIRARRGVNAFWVPAIAAGLSWLLPSLYYWQTSGAFIAPRMAAMLQVGHPVYLVLIAGIVGFIGGGVAGFAGFSIRQLYRDGRSS